MLQLRHMLEEANTESDSRADCERVVAFLVLKQRVDYTCSLHHNHDLHTNRRRRRPYIRSFASLETDAKRLLKPPLLASFDELLLKVPLVQHLSLSIPSSLPPSLTSPPLVLSVSARFSDKRPPRD